MDDEVAREPTEWPIVFMTMAKTIASRSKDPSSQCGAVLVSPDNRVISTGFNGPPPQVVDSSVPWGERPEKYFWVFHAEEGAINFALDSHGSQSLQGATLYVTTRPCSRCVLRMIRVGIHTVIYDDVAKRPRMVDDSHDKRVEKILSCLKPGTHFQLIPFSSFGYVSPESAPLHTPGRRYGVFWWRISTWAGNYLRECRKWLRQLPGRIRLSCRRLPGLGD